jgi:DNA-binding NtrC family response regulator
MGAAQVLYFKSNKSDSMEKMRVYVVEDDPWYGEILKHHLDQNPLLEVSLFTNARDCIQEVDRKPDVVCVDYGLPDMDGDMLLEQLLLRIPDLPVIIISGQEDISVAVNLLKQGARDYFPKDDHTRELVLRSILNIHETLSLKKQVIELTNKLQLSYDIEKAIPGKSFAVRKLTELIEKAADTHNHLILLGESGVGKGEVARTIHYNSDRRMMPIVEVNASVFNHEQLERELFGYEKGAFPGAYHPKAGKFEEVAGGTLFIDHLHLVDHAMQGKLVQVIQSGVFMRIGGDQPIPVEFRLMGAMPVDIVEEVQDGRFREDLYFVMHGMSIEVPPLRQRGKDVLLYAKQYVREYSTTNKKRKIFISREAEDKLMSYHYPGNLRELKSTINTACVMCGDNVIKPEHIVFHEISKYTQFSNREKTLREFTAEIITDYLKKYDQDVMLVAKKLDIGKSTIYNMMKSGAIDMTK